VTVDSTLEGFLVVFFLTGSFSGTTETNSSASNFTGATFFFVVVIGVFLALGFCNLTNSFSLISVTVINCFALRP